MGVPLLDLRSQTTGIREELKEAFLRVLDSGQYILGPEVEALESDLKTFLGVKFAIGLTSGTDALLLALMALGIGPGDEVICPSFTFFATAGCIARVGATPVFADSCIDTFNIDPGDAERRVTSRTKAIIPVHLFGQAADMNSVCGFAQRHGLTVIEDAAQALGAEYHGRRVGGIGTFGAFSFFPSKNLGGYGDSGLLVTNDETLAEKARCMRVHGMKPKYHVRVAGGNFRMDPVQAALLRVKLPHLAEYMERRQENARYYNERLNRMEGIGEDARICLPVLPRSGRHVWNQYTLRVQSDDRGEPAKDREGLRTYLSERGIGSEIYYPVPMHRQECFRHLGESVLPVAEKLAAEVLSIPIFPEMTRDQQDQVIEAVEQWLSC